MPRSIRYFLIAFLTGIFFIAGSTSCSKQDVSMCQRDNTFQQYKKKKNKNNYGTRYGTKAKPVRKDYVIKNKRTGKRY
jgi:hypothetical protein